MKRYYLALRDTAKGHVFGLAPRADGNWVNYADLAPLIAALADAALSALVETKEAK